MSIFRRYIEEYSDTCGLNPEDTRILFENCCDNLYDGNMDRFLDDLAAGHIVTEDGLVGVRQHIYAQMDEMWG